MYHMSALDIHGEGQLEAVTIWEGWQEGETGKEWQGGDTLAGRGLMCFFTQNLRPRG